MLVQRCRQLKETLLGTDAPERLTVNLPWSGSRLIGGGLQIEVTREEAARPAGRGLFSARCRWTPSRAAASRASRSSGCPTRPTRP